MLQPACQRSPSARHKKILLRVLRFLLRMLAAFCSPPYTAATMFTEIWESLRQIYLEDARPRLGGFNGGITKNS